MRAGFLNVGGITTVWTLHRSSARCMPDQISEDKAGWGAMAVRSNFAPLSHCDAVMAAAKIRYTVGKKERLGRAEGGWRRILNCLLTLHHFMLV